MKKYNSVDHFHLFLYAHVLSLLISYGLFAFPFKLSAFSSMLDEQRKP